MNVTVNNTIKQIDVYTEQNVRHYDIHIQGIKWRSSMVGGTLTTPQEMLDASPGFYYILDLTDTHPDFNAKQGVLIVYQNPTGKTYQAIVGDKIWLYKASDGHYYPIEGGGSSYGGVIGTEQEMDTALPGKFYAFSLHESHSEFAASNGALFVMNSDEADGVIQVATVVISGAVKQYARSGEVNAYSAFAEISGGGEVPVFPENTITSVSLAQLPAGSNVSGKNALEVLDLAINAELFPTTLSAPTYSFSITPSGLQEVGSTHFMGFTRTFNRGSITPQYQSESPYRAGTLIDYTETGHFGIEEYQILLGANTWTSRANYNAGVQPKGSKGTNYQSPLPAGSTAIVTRTITGVYPVYATTANISLYTKLGLLAHGADIDVNKMVAETDGAKQSIRIPQAWGTIASLQQLNDLSGQWDNIDLSTFTKTAVQLTINGSTVNYWEYTHNGATIGSRRLKFRL